MAADLIRAGLRRRHIDRVCHMTSCHHLPSIVSEGGILSLQERAARRIPEAENPHYWGPGKKFDLGAFVVCSFMAPWWMCQRRDEELAMILLDADDICTRPDARFCPVNSAKGDFSAEEILARDGIGAFDDCFENETTYQARNAEVFVRRLVPVASFREIVFCDGEAAGYWVPKINEAFDAAEPPLEAPDKIDALYPGTFKFRFPGTYVPTRRIRDER